MYDKTRKLPSLEDLCVQSAIDNLQHLRDVGQTDLTLLQKILPHCTAEQLHRIEISSNGRDLSLITDDLWHKFYTRKFGIQNAKLVLERMKKRHVSFKWRLLYQAKLREQEEVQQKGVDRLRQLYAEANNLKQTRQIQVCTKVPPTKKRRSDAGGGVTNHFVNGNGNLMKKLRSEFLERNNLMNARMMHGPSPSKANFQKPQRPTLHCPQNLSKSPQNIQAFQRPSKHQVLKVDQNCKVSSSKNVMPRKTCTTASKSPLGMISKR